MKFKAPPHIRGGIDIGGAHFRIDEYGVLELPDDGNYSSLLSADFVPIPMTAPAVPAFRYETAPDEHLDN